jgi:hypothetical protein
MRNEVGDGFSDRREAGPYDERGTWAAVFRTGARPVPTILGGYGVSLMSVNGTRDDPYDGERKTYDY